MRRRAAPRAGDVLVRAGTRDGGSSARGGRRRARYVLPPLRVCAAPYDALKKLRTIDVAGTRRANQDLSILFCRNDRAYIKADRGARVSRGPGVVLVSLAAAQSVAPDGRGDMQWDDVVAEYACDGASLKGFPWSSILASVEFKVCANISNPPPATYSGLGQVILAKVDCFEPTPSYSRITSTKPNPSKSADADNDMY